MRLAKQFHFTSVTSKCSVARNSLQNGRSVLSVNNLLTVENYTEMSLRKKWCRLVK